MAKSLINKLNSYVPTKEDLQEKKSLRWLIPLLKNRKLWIIQRKTVANAMFVGMFSAFTPWPLQMTQAAIMSIFFNANVPIAVALVWITNPITMAPMFYGTYKFGAFLLDFEGSFPEFELSFNWLFSTLGEIWQPLLLGSFAIGILTGIFFWFLSHILWQKSVINKWNTRNNTTTK
jgi:uncharacterized protein (DUF2062 family)